METISSAQSEQLLALLVQRVDDQRADLVGRYHSVLREALFSNSAQVRPSMLKSIAAEEPGILIEFLRRGVGATEHGEQLQQAGFSARAVLKLIQATRQFLLNDLEDHQIAATLEIVDAYEMAAIEGYIRSIDNINKAERAQMERVIAALEQRVGK